MPSRYSIDTAAGTASFDLYIGEVYQTQYVYAAGLVTLAARPLPIVVSRAGFYENFDLINMWKQLIANNLAPPASTRWMSKIILRRLNGPPRIKLEYEISEVPFISATFRQNQDEVTIDPRPQLILPWSDFVAWRDLSMHQFRQEIDYMVAHS